MHTDPDVEVDAEATLRLSAEPGHFPGVLQAGVHSPAHVVLVRDRVAEHRQQPVTFRGSDMSLVAVHGPLHQLVVAADEYP